MHPIVTILKGEVRSLEERFWVLFRFHTDIDVGFIVNDVGRALMTAQSQVGRFCPSFSEELAARLPRLIKPTQGSW